MISVRARKSTLLVGCVFITFALWYLHRGRTTWSIGAGSLGIFLIATAALSSRWSERFYSGWMKLGAALGYVNSRVLLSVMYYLVLTPVGTFRRTLGRDPLVRRGPRQRTYWVTRAATRQSRAGFERAF